MDHQKTSPTQAPIKDQPPVTEKPPVPPKNWRKFTVPALLLMLIALPLAIFLTQREQDIRQNAAESSVSSAAASGTNGRKCVAGNTATYLIIDRSNSMRNETSNQDKTTRINYAKKSATRFVNVMAQQTTNRIGVAWFARGGGVSINAGNNYTQVKNAISDLEAEGPIGTCMECAILAVNDRFKAGGASSGIKKKYAIILSDGNANIVRMGDGSINPNIDEKRGIDQALQAIMTGHRRDGTIFYTIGLGQYNNADGRAFLQKAAKDTGGKYYFAPTAAQLEKIFEEIAYTVGKGSISGTTFEDKNDNKVYESGSDSPLPNVTVQLKLATSTASTSAPIATVKTNAQGQYSFTDLCAEKYHIIQEPISGYTQNVPLNPNYHVIDATQPDTEFKDKNFGNIKGTTSITPPVATAAASFTFSFSLHGIGIAGDNVLPRPASCQQRGTASSSSATVCLSNQDPITPMRDITLIISDEEGNEVATADGTMEYDAQAGIFTGSSELQENIAPGLYSLKAVTAKYLRKDIATLLEIEPGGTYTLPLADMVSSDVDNDNQLSVLDYNQIISCYTIPGQSTPCDENEILKVETDDDGDLDEFDINLFLRDLSVQFGD